MSTNHTITIHGATWPMALPDAVTAIAVAAFADACNTAVGATVDTAALLDAWQGVPRRDVANKLAAATVANVPTAMAAWGEQFGDVFARLQAVTDTVAASVGKPKAVALTDAERATVAVATLVAAAVAIADANVADAELVTACHTLAEHAAHDVPSAVTVGDGAWDKRVSQLAQQAAAAMRGASGHVAAAGTVSANVAAAIADAGKPTDHCRDSRRPRRTVTARLIVSGVTAVADAADADASAVTAAWLAEHGIGDTAVTADRDPVPVLITVGTKQVRGFAAAD